MKGSADKKRRRLRIAALVWIPPLAAAALGGWLATPSHGVATAATPGGSGGGSGSALAAAAAAPGAGGVPARIIYQEQCASCHGDDGRGTERAPSLAGVGEAAVDFQLTTGRMPKKDDSSKQPPFRSQLPPADISALNRYVTALVAAGGPAIPSVDPAAGDLGSGEDLYNEECAACHSVRGSGGILYDRPVPKVTGATPTQVAEAIRVGPAAMPVFGPKEISQSQLNDIVAYVQTLGRPHDSGGNALSHVGPVAEGLVAWLIGMVGLLLVIRWIGQRG